VDPTNGSFTILGGATKPHNTLDHLTGFVIENLPTLLDEPGEWFLSRAGRLTYLPRPGEDLATVRATYPVLEKLLTFAGSAARPVAHLEFRDLRFRHAKGVATLATFEPNQAAVARVDGVITLEQASAIRFEGCELAHFGSYGFSLRRGTHDVTIERCLITDMGAGGVKVGQPERRTEGRRRGARQPDPITASSATAGCSSPARSGSGSARRPITR